MPGCSGAKKSTKHDIIYMFHNLSATKDSQQNKPFLMYNVAELHVDGGTIYDILTQQVQQPRRILYLT